MPYLIRVPGVGLRLRHLVSMMVNQLGGPLPDAALGAAGSASSRCRP
jgi:hypothetical protein